MIVARDLTKTFNAGTPAEFTAIHSVSLEMALHEMTLIKGPSGSGKTTLLSMLGCMCRPTSGRIFIRERDVTCLPERFLTEIRRSTFGFIFQQLHLIKDMSVLENILAPAYPAGRPYAELSAHGMELLGRFRLESRAKTMIKHLSGGEAQRVAIARALINNPAILIADEPTAHLDSALTLEFMDHMAALKAEGMTIIMASHDPLVLESGLAELVLEMRGGRLIDAGTSA